MITKEQNSFEQEDTIDIQGLLIRVLFNWYWVLLSVIFTSGLAFLYVRYSNNIYNTKANIRILDAQEKAEIKIDLDQFMNKSNINLENEMAILKSYRINKMVVERLNSHINYFQIGRIQTSQIYNPPFVVKLQKPKDSTNQHTEFYVEMSSKGYKLTNAHGDTLSVDGFYFTNPTKEFPITISPRNLAVKELDITDDQVYFYEVHINTIQKATLDLIQALTVESYGKDSDILSISLNTYSTEYAEDAINTLIEVFVEDDISDRQQISKRTIEFIDQRFVFLTSELDSIESNKKAFKQDNDLSLFQADATTAIQARTIKEEQTFNLESQLVLANVLLTSLVQDKEFKLLPADIGLTSQAVNNLVNKYNTALLEYNKLKSSAGSQNPTVKILKESLVKLNANIQSSLKGYIKQLEQNLELNVKAQSLVNNSFKSLPKKEMVLRSIERQQTLKESLYLLLLQKREEASIEMAVLAPKVKVIDYAISNPIPISPKKIQAHAIGILLGLVLSIGVIYLKFIFDTKIYTVKDIESINSNAPILVEIPKVKQDMDGSFINNQHSQLADAFRTLAHNIEFLVPLENNQKSRVILITSSIKGEGKTLISFNTSLAYAQLQKKVLLIGADLRNPQLHRYTTHNKSQAGLSNYLVSDNLSWQDLTLRIENGSTGFDMILSGDIPPTPSLLLSGKKFKTFIQEVKAVYDYVIIDSAPTVLVADTLTFSSNVDASIYVVRSDFSSKDLIQHSKKLAETQKIKNLAFVLNDVDYRRSYGYGYGYGYNYGYGYGYGAESRKKPWYKFL